MNLPQLGARVVEGGTRFAAYATNADSCRVTILAGDIAGAETHAMKAVGDGVFSVDVPGIGPGRLYELYLNDDRFPDPYARFLPQGVHGPAMVVAPERYRWRHGDGVAVPPDQTVVYELHVGTFTTEGTFAAATERLADVADLGVTTIELLPVSAFAGRWGWGYDGVAHFAPHAAYGTPDQLRGFVDQAHGLGLAVLLDVVYNHFGPAGNYLSTFSSHYFTREIQTAWGDAPNFAHPIMRSYVLDNARAWLTDYRFDGLRLDATHAIADGSPKHILRELADMAHGLSPRKLLIAEDERNDPALITDLGLDGMWADDFHHAAHVTATGEQDGYYESYAPGAATVAAAIQSGWLYEGQLYPATGKPRGKPASGLPAEAFVYCLQNHDQVGNRALGDRLSHVSGIEASCALATVLLFVPMTPLLFMGEEWAASAPFQFFTDHEPELGKNISSGRREEFKRFKAFAEPTVRDRIPDPQSEDTFRRSKLRWEERADGDHARVLALYKSLLHLRRSDPVLCTPSRERLEVRSAGTLLICRRWSDGDERLLLANLGADPVDPAVLRRELADGTVMFRSDDPRPGDRSVALPPWTALIAGNRVRNSR